MDADIVYRLRRLGETRRDLAWRMARQRVTRDAVNSTPPLGILSDQSYSNSGASRQHALTTTLAVRRPPQLFQA